MKIISCMTPEIWSTTDRIFFAFWTIFCPFTPPSPPPPPPLQPRNPENPNFEKMKKTPGDIIILHECTINDNHIWYMVPEIWSASDRIFYHLGSSWLDSDRILARLMIIGYTVTEIWHVTDVIVIFHSGLHFSLLSP